MMEKSVERKDVLVGSLKLPEFKGWCDKRCVKLTRGCLDIQSHIILDISVRMILNEISI